MGVFLYKFQLEAPESVLIFSGGIADADTLIGFHCTGCSVVLDPKVIQVIYPQAVLRSG